MFDKISGRQLLEQIGSAQSTPLAVKDREHRFVYLNEAFARAVGRSAEELLGKHDLELGRPENLVFGNPQTGWPGLWELGDQAMNSGNDSSNIEIGHDERVNIETHRTALLNDDGEVVGLLVQLQDVGEVRELKSNVENNREALWIQKGEATTLDNVLAALLACHDTNALFNQLVDSIVSSTGADGAYVAKVHESGEYLEYVAVSGIHEEVFTGDRRYPGEGLLGKVWDKGTAAFVDDLGNTHSHFTWESQTQCFAIPLMVDGLTVGVLCVVSASNSEDLAKQIPLLERIVAVATIAIANTLLMDANAKTLARTQAMGEVSRILNTVDSATDAWEAVCRALLPMVEAKRASTFLLDENETLFSHTSWGMENEAVFQIAKLPDTILGASINNWCVTNGEAAVIGRYDEDPRESTAVHELREQMNIGCTCCVPLYKGDKLEGALTISRNRDQRDFNENDIADFTAVVNQLSSALERHKLADELKYQAFHDQLTTLPNRQSFELALNDAINDSQAHCLSGSVLVINLDGFKVVNDTQGHAAGDLLLALVSQSFSGCIKPSDILARTGGDEFAVIVCGESNEDQISLIAEQLLSSLSTPFNVLGERVSIGASIGVCNYNGNDPSGDEVLRHAEIAMYHAKYSGKGQIIFFDEKLGNQVRKHRELESELHQALENKEFRLVYQPQVHCSDNLVVGAEALIRWENPSRGLVPPVDFIPLAENIGLINSIGEWVIEEAVRQLAQWQQTSLKDLRVSINIAATQFLLDDFTDQVLGALQRHRVNPCLLELEITESIVMNDVALVVQRLQVLREAGVRVAIDDFGTGYSSLSYLQDLPLDVLKIDRSFVMRLVGETGEQSLVKTIQLLASGLGLETVAEGVESIEQKESVTQLGCDFIQGYLHSRPVSPDQIPAVVREIQSYNQGPNSKQSVAA